eukprot:6201146-Pleurochrysis_carterae.AAC.1
MLRSEPAVDEFGRARTISLAIEWSSPARAAESASSSAAVSSYSQLLVVVNSRSRRHAQATRRVSAAASTFATFSMWRICA